VKGDHERSVIAAEQLSALRDLFDSEIKRIDQILHEREKESQKSLAEALRAREIANEWRGAMDDREHNFARIENLEDLRKQVIEIRRGVDTSNARRATWVAAAGIIATLLAIGVGQIIRQGITSADVSQQISREAPWNKDKSAVTRRIGVLEAQVQHQALEISQLQSDLRAHVILDAQRDGRR